VLRRSVEFAGQSCDSIAPSQLTFFGVLIQQHGLREETLNGAVSGTLLCKHSFTTLLPFIGPI
jgi:hypothetical protein